MKVHFKSRKYSEVKHFALLSDFILPKKEEREGKGTFKWIISLKEPET